jgi:hypothetical protein
MSSNALLSGQADISELPLDLAATLKRDLHRYFLSHGLFPSHGIDSRKELILTGPPRLICAPPVSLITASEFSEPTSQEKISPPSAPTMRAVSARPCASAASSSAILFNTSSPPAAALGHAIEGVEGVYDQHSYDS